MKRVVFLFLIILSCVAFADDVSAEGKKVAVYIEGAINNDDKSIVCSAVLARLSGNNNYAAFERNSSFINALNREQDYQLSGEVPEKEIRTVGQRFGVDFVVVVEVIIAKDNYCHMAARLINLTTGEIVKSTNIKREYTDSAMLSGMASNVAYRLFNLKSK